MDCSSSPEEEEKEEEEEDEFFEASNCIASSSSDSEPRCEGERCGKASQHDASDYSSPISKYDIWKTSAGTIVERRHRLRVQMGLKSDQYDALIVAMERHGVLSDLKPFIEKNENANLVKRENTFECIVKDGGFNVGKSENKMQETYEKKDRNHGHMREKIKHGWTTIRSRSTGTFYSLENTNLMEGSRLEKSTIASPVLHYRGGGYRNVNGYPSSKPPLGLKNSDGNDEVCVSSLTKLHISRRSQLYWNKLGKSGRFDVITDKNEKSNCNMRCSSLDRILQRSRKDDRIIESKNNADMSIDDRDVLCRVKDLDSGKEFIVNEVGNNGMWNRLEELDTGREITLEEFESSLGFSPIVCEVMRRVKEENDAHRMGVKVHAKFEVQEKRRGWLQAIIGAVHDVQKKGSYNNQKNYGDNKEALAECQRSRSTRVDNHDTSTTTLSPVKVHTNKKGKREFSGLHLRQEIQAHDGAVRVMKFSHDGAYLASAGRDKEVRVWEVVEQNMRSTDSCDESGELADSLRYVDLKNSKCRFRMKCGDSQLGKVVNISENVKCNFSGHTEDILDLSWSPSLLLLSSSMDKTVRLWSISSGVCLKVFKHNDYVTCVQFHPLDDDHFISGSLDGKVRIWRIHELQVVDWVDLQEMVTAACYSPDGQNAIVGSYKGTCRLYNTSGNKLQFDASFEVQKNKSKHLKGRKITGFQFIPGCMDKVLITSSDSRMYIYSGTEMLSKYKGFRNAKSQISASFTSNGLYMVCASEDSRVYIWNYVDSSFGYTSQQRKLSDSYEFFSSRHVLVALSWPGRAYQPQESRNGDREEPDIYSSSTEHKKGLNYNVSSSSPSTISSSLSECDMHRKSFDRSSSSTSRESMCEPDALGLMQGPTSFTLNQEDCDDNDRYCNCCDDEEPRCSRIMPSNSYLEDCIGTNRTLVDGKYSGQVYGDEKGLSHNKFVRDGKGFSDNTIVVDSTEYCNRNFADDKEFSNNRIIVGCTESSKNGIFSDIDGTSSNGTFVASKRSSNLGSFINSKECATCPEKEHPLLKEENVQHKCKITLSPALGMVIVTAGLEGKIRIYQNFNPPVHL